MKQREKIQYICTIIFTLAALIGMVLYNFMTFYANSVSDMIMVGESALEQETSLLNAYLSKGQDVLQVTAVTIEYMMQQGEDSEAIERFLTEESKRYQAEIDANFTGIYGLFQGEYIDGIGWIPEEGYVPQEREWYIAAKEAAGRPTMVSPYLDAQTNTIMISVSQLLYDGESVISIDIALDEIQIITEDLHMNEKGYGFVMDKAGLVVAHTDERQKGENYREKNEMQTLLERIEQQKEGYFRSRLQGERCTVFVNTIMDDWYVVLVVSDTKLFKAGRTVLLQNALLCLGVFLLLLSFCTVSFRRIRIHMQNAEESRQRAEDLNITIMRTLARTIDAKDRYTNGHSQRVAKYAKMLAERMGKTPEECNTIYDAALLHDVGKIHIPDLIINKPSRLTEEEYTHMKLHPVSGYYILRDIKEKPMIAQAAKWHHERYDGLGYPSGLVGNDIPEIARIIGVADAYDAMTSNRSYRSVMPQEKVREEIIRGRGTQFDPEIADIMLQMIDEDSDYELRQDSKTVNKIMAVDDESMYLDIIEFILKDEPRYELICKNSGMDAIYTLKEQQIDLIFLDLQMPYMDGFQTYEKIREISDVPVVFMTGDKKLSTINKAQEMGVEDYLVKPFMSQAILEILRSILQEKI